MEDRAQIEYEIGLREPPTSAQPDRSRPGPSSVGSRPPRSSASAHPQRRDRRASAIDSGAFPRAAEVRGRRALAPPYATPQRTPSPVEPSSGGELDRPDPEQTLWYAEQPRRQSAQPASPRHAQSLALVPVAAGPVAFQSIRIEAPPQCAVEIYSLARRVALQHDLKAADRVLRVGLAELTDATMCSTWYLGEDGAPFSLELRASLTELQASVLEQALASAQPRAVAGLLVIPVVAVMRVIALLVLECEQGMSEFTAEDQLVAMAVAQETAGFLHQLMDSHAQLAADVAADARSLYTPQSLAKQRNRDHAGALIHLSPLWVRCAYPAIVLTIAIAITFAALARSPTYSSGAGIITIEGIEVTAAGPGSVATVHVQAGQQVRAGQELIRFVAQEEESGLTQAEREYSNAMATLLFDGADDSNKAAVAGAAMTRQRARDRLEARVIRAPADGVVGDVRVRPGAALDLGNRVLTLLRRDAQPIALVFLPGQDRPRLRAGQTIQIDLEGYTKMRERATIMDVGAEVIGPTEARRVLGQNNADAVPLQGPVVMVRARLPSATFRADRFTFHYHDGMPLSGEVKIDNKPFLVTLVPALERFF
jgi:multidrug resistance efflux pump